ncbi:MAG: glutamine synthetase III, partial [Eubacteriales bacterium]|nr:glutamine synthetase III [Eubacteriales bacterium]
MSTMSAIYGAKVFDDRAMKQYLASDVYKSLRKTIDEGEQLDLHAANAVALGMKEWAVNQGATHFTHWFQPMTGITAEKHDSFISPQKDGSVIMDFSGKELIKGEPDASSFPSGGLRATFEARGYTAWDPTSYAFIKENTLCIPTAFCSFSGEALDTKTPLLRSMDSLSREALKILKLLGNTTARRVSSCAGAEQEYFLVTEELFEKRPDLKLCGRTLFGAKSPKGQEMDDHYFGSLKPRVKEFMRDLDNELWMLGIAAKTEHNEVAPAQHELACVYTVANVAVDQNQLVMELMKKTAIKHGLRCLLHEKPFAGVNGSGKHNNWSMATDDGINLLSMGKTSEENKRFLLFLSAVIKAVDDYQDLLRISVSSAGNDHRLGADEAPPAVVSIFLGEELTKILEAIEKDIPYEKSEAVFMKLGTDVLPSFKRDNTDRNRTSPFAFTGNKFEFRMPGSSDSIAAANVMINSAVADTLAGFYDELKGAEDIEKAIFGIIKKTITEHKRIIFNGNGYEADWIKEAEKRGLKNYRTTVDAIPHLTDEKNVAMLTRQGVFTAVEVESRKEIMFEIYVKTLGIELETAVTMAKRSIAPAVSGYAAKLAKDMIKIKSCVPELKCEFERGTIERLSVLADEIIKGAEAIENRKKEIAGLPLEEKAAAVSSELVPMLGALRA